jgi:hypothetical protein
VFGPFPRRLPGNAPWAAVGVFLLFLVAGAAWVASPTEETAGQSRTTAPSPADAPQTARSPAPPPADLGDPDDLPALFGDAPASPAAEVGERAGIPGLSAIEVTGNLKHLVADGTFPCDGPSPDAELVLWSCAHPSGLYAVEVVGDDPLRVFSVTASVGEVGERDAEVLFSRILDLSREDASALNTEAWISGRVPAGGSTFSDGAEISVYGTDTSRAMSVVSTGACPD